MACGGALLVALAAFGLHVAAASGQGFGLSVAGVRAPASLKSDDEENVSGDEDSEAASWVDLMYAAHDWLARRDERGHDLELWLHPKHHTENIAVHYLLIIAHGMLAYSPLIILIIWCTRPPAREVVERSSRG